MPTKFSDLIINNKIKTIDESSHIIGLYPKSGGTGYDNCVVPSDSIISKIEAYDNTAVHKLGNETIIGEKTFTGTTVFTETTSFGSNTSGITAPSDDSSTKFATTEFVQNIVSIALSSTLSALYPVGSIYIGTQSTCPLTTLIQGSTWVAIEGRYLLASGTLEGTSEAYSATDTAAAGAPNITGSIGFRGHDSGWYSGCVYGRSDIAGGTWDNTSMYAGTAYIDASRSSSVYGASTTVRTPAYVVNVWRRTA